MGRRLRKAAALAALAVAIYFIAWPVPVDPVAWRAPVSAGYVGPFARNERLKNLELLPIGNHHGPESIAIDADGRIYAATREGAIVRLRADSSSPEEWVATGGRPLGIRFDRAGNLYVADALRGLLRIAPDRTLTVLATEADGKPIRYANSVVPASDGKVYFTDASTKFGAREFGGTYEASLFDVMEHGSHGRVLVYDPATRRATTLIANLNFANGITLAHDESYLLVNDMASYRVLRHWLAGPRRGTTEPLIENLPGFADNLSTGRDGRFWLALVSPRNALLDRVSGAPFVRKMIQRLPAFIRPEAVAYGHIVAFDGSGRIVASLQDPEGAYRLTTEALETPEWIYVGSLVMPKLGRLPRFSSTSQEFRMQNAE